MAISKIIPAEKLKKRGKIQSILEYWNNNEKKWIRSCELRKEFVKKYKDKKYLIKTDEEYTKKNIKKPLYTYDSEFYRDLSKMKDVGILDYKEIPQKKGKPATYYRPGEKHRFDPMKIWHKDAVMNTPSNNIYSIVNTTFYLHGLSTKDLSKEEKLRLEEIKHKFDEYYWIIEQQILKKAGFRKANKKWEDFVNKQECTPFQKFLLWLILISSPIISEIYGILLNKWEKNQDLRIEKNTTDKYSYNKDVKTIIDQWRCNFYDILGETISIYFAKKYPDFKKMISSTISEMRFNKILKSLNNLIKDIDDILADSVLFHEITQSMSYNIADLKLRYLPNEGKANNIMNAMLYSYYNHPVGKRIKKIIKDKGLSDPNEEIMKIHMESMGNKYQQKSILSEQEFKRKGKKSETLKNEVAKKNTFFRDNKFFNGFDEEVKQLGITMDYLYKKMDEYASIFYMPKLP